MTPLLEREIYLFDLDNTLYDPKNQLIEQIVTRMTHSVAAHLHLAYEQAYQLCEEYYQQYGGTLRGLQLHHPQVDLEQVCYEAHDVDLSGVIPCPALSHALANTLKTRYVFTNSPRQYAERVLQHLGLSDYVDGIFSVELTDYKMKPDPHAYRSICQHFGFDATQAVLFDDQLANVATGQELGMRTVLVNRSDITQTEACYRTEALPDFLQNLNLVAANTHG